MDTIKFDIKTSNKGDLISLLIYRKHEQSSKWGYVDSIHPMTVEEIKVLKMFLSKTISNKIKTDD